MEGEPTNTWGRSGYGCACVHPDARSCSVARCGYGYRADPNEKCACVCHDWQQEDDEEWAA